MGVAMKATVQHLLSTVRWGDAFVHHLAQLLGALWCPFLGPLAHVFVYLGTHRRKPSGIPDLKPLIPVSLVTSLGSRHIPSDQIDVQYPPLSLKLGDGVIFFGLYE